MAEWLTLAQSSSLFFLFLVRFWRSVPTFRKTRLLRWKGRLDFLRGLSLFPPVSSIQIPGTKTKKNNRSFPFFFPLPFSPKPPLPPRYLSPQFLILLLYGLVLSCLFPFFSFHLPLVSSTAFARPLLVVPFHPAPAHLANLIYHHSPFLLALSTRPSFFFPFFPSKLSTSSLTCLVQVLGFNLPSWLGPGC